MNVVSVFAAILIALLGSYNYVLLKLYNHALFWSWERIGPGNAKTMQSGLLAGLADVT